MIIRIDEFRRKSQCSFVQTTTTELRIIGTAEIETGMHEHALSSAELLKKICAMTKIQTSPCKDSRMKKALQLSTASVAQRFFCLCNLASCFLGRL